jgi:hypothetical protein
MSHIGNSGSSGTNPPGTITLRYTYVNTSPYVVTSSDEFLGVDSSIMPITIELPNAPSTGRVYIIKDLTGSSSSNNITVTTVGGVVNIDGSSTFVMNASYESIEVLFNGSSYLIF